MTYPADAPRWRRYVRFWRRDVQRDIDEELRFHFDARIEELTAQGMPEADARAAANREFGDVGAVRRGLREIDDRAARRRDRGEWFGGVRQDVRYSVRSLSRSPGLSIGILLTLALGIGVNAVMFSILDTVYLRPPAGVVAPAGLRHLWSERHFTTGTQYWPGYSYPVFAAVTDAIGERARTTLYLAPAKMRVGPGQGVADAQVTRAKADYFPLLGVRAALGRVYTPDEDRLGDPGNVALASMSFWRRALSADSSAIGKPIVIGGRSYTLVGVLPERFTGVDLDAADLWLPLASLTASGSGKPWWQSRGTNGFRILVRPRAGISDGEMEHLLTGVLRRPDVRSSSADTAAVARFGSVNLARGPGKVSQEMQIARSLAGVAVVVLLIAGANVVNLLLARAVRRRREIAVRLALGVSRARLVRLLLAESLVLALGAAVVSLVAAYWGAMLMRALLLPDIHWAESPLDWKVVLFALAVALLAGLVAGLIPAMQAISPRLTVTLKAGAGDGIVQRSRLRSALVAAQAALSVMLLVGALLFVRSLANVRALDIGYDAGRLLMVTPNLDRAQLADASIPARMTDLAQRVAKLPGVDRVARSTMQPMYGLSWINYYTETDSLGSRPRWTPIVTGVSPGYFATVGMRILVGEDFPQVSGDAMPDAVVVNEAMAKGLWPGRNAIGQCIRFGSRAGACYRVIGVVQTARVDRVIEDPSPQYYLPLDRWPASAETLSGTVLIVRASSTPGASLSREIRALAGQQFPGVDTRTMAMSGYLEPQYRPWQLGATLFTCFGVLALIVAVIGIYSTVAYTVSQRTHEFGVRIALGARVGDVVRLVVGEGVRTVAVGVACGVGLALAGGKLIAALLYGVRPSDPAALLAVAVGLLSIAVLAALVPAWRASKVDPVSALRSD